MEIFHYKFLLNPFIVGILISIIAGLLSFFIILRKLSFLVVGISHSALAGIALGFIFNINPYITTFLFCLITGFFIGKITKMGNIEYDTSIGIFFSFTMAIAIFLIYLGKIKINLISFLFGSIMGISNFNLYFTIAIFILFLIVYFLIFKSLIFITFDEDVAKVSGINVELIDSFFLLMVSSIIVISLKLIGIVLTSAFLILPASFSFNISKSYRSIILLSIIFAIISFIIGFYLSFFYDIPTGATIVFISTIMYFFSLLIKALS